MAPDFIPQAFDLFAQAARTPDRSQGGLGLGLALVKNLVELHGGQVACASEGLGKGSQFTVRLPRPTSSDEDASNS
jgi:signal transduction histidine kinase